MSCKIGPMSFVSLNLSEARRLDTANFGISDGVLHPDRVTDYHDLLYIQEGGRDVWEEEHLFQLRPGDALFLFQGRHHFGRVNCRPGTRWIYLHFPRAKGDQFLRDRVAEKGAEEMRVAFPSCVRCGNDRHFHQLLRDAVHYFWSSLRLNRQRARVVLLEVLLELAAKGQHVHEDGRASAVDAVIRYIEAHPETTDPLDQLAGMARMSRRLFTRKFREVTGKTVRQYQLEHKIRIARSLLHHNPEMRLKEVARMLGFFDEFHFSKAFKLQTGVAPSGYRGR